MTVRLRPHHLLCMLTFVGKGYTPAFTANLDRIVTRLNAGERLEVVAGPDDICRPLLGGCGEVHCLTPGVVDRDRRAARDVGLVLGRPVEAGATLVLDQDAISTFRAAFQAGVSRSACRACEWDALCSSVAAGGFAGARLGAERSGAA